MICRQWLWTDWWAILSTITQGGGGGDWRGGVLFFLICGIVVILPCYSTHALSLLSPQRPESQHQSSDPSKVPAGGFDPVYIRCIHVCICLSSSFACCTVWLECAKQWCRTLESLWRQNSLNPTACSYCRCHTDGPPLKGAGGTVAQPDRKMSLWNTRKKGVTHYRSALWHWEQICLYPSQGGVSSVCSNSMLNICSYCAAQYLPSLFHARAQIDNDVFVFYI